MSQRHFNYTWLRVFFVVYFGLNLYLLFKVQFTQIDITVREI